MNKYKPNLTDLNRHWRRMLYSKIVNIFEYKNLPEEINEQAMKLGLFLFGKLVFYKIGEKHLVQNFSYTDKLDWYYVPAHGRVVNPWLPSPHQNWQFEIDKECVVWNCTPDIYSFRERSMVSDLVYKTASQLSENDMSYYCIQRNHRLFAIITAQDDKQRAEADRMLDHMYNADPEIVMKEDLVSRIQVNPISSNATRSPLTELIEFHQFILANFYHSFGINSNYNLKREQLNSNEITVNEDVMRLNIEDMLECRQRGFEKINDKFGLNISVNLNEEVYASLIQAAKALEQGDDVGEVQENERENSANITSEGENNVKNTEETERDGLEYNGSGSNDEQDEAGEEGTPENEEEISGNEEQTEQNTPDNDKEISVTVIVNNGEVQNFGQDDITNEKGEDENVEMRDTKEMG